jgi:hypothetical protein
MDAAYSCCFPNGVFVRFCLLAGKASMCKIHGYCVKFINPDFNSLNWQFSVFPDNHRNWLKVNISLYTKHTARN